MRKKSLLLVVLVLVGLGLVVGIGLSSDVPENVLKSCALNCQKRIPDDEKKMLVCFRNCGIGENRLNEFKEMVKRPRSAVPVEEVKEEKKPSVEEKKPPAPTAPGRGCSNLEQCKNIDKVWRVMGKRLNILEAKEDKVWDPGSGSWKGFGEVYPAVSPAPISVACPKAPIDPNLVKTTSNTLHDRPGHGWVKCRGSKCAVDLRPGNTCEEANNAARTAAIRSPIDGYVGQSFELKDTKRGNCIVIFNAQNIDSSSNVAVMCHADLISGIGNQVKVGDVVGRLTSWECERGVFGPHLHFELKLNGQWISGDGFFGTWRNQLNALGCT